MDAPVFDLQGDERALVLGTYDKRLWYLTDGPEGSRALRKFSGAHGAVEVPRCHAIPENLEQYVDSLAAETRTEVVRVVRWPDAVGLVLAEAS